MKRRGWGFSEAARRLVVGWLVMAGSAITWMGVPVTAVAAPPEVVLTQADILVGDDSALPPPDSAPWQPVTLPDRPWTRPNVYGYAWYRMRFELVDQPQSRQAIFVEYMRAVGACFVNGTEVGQYGEFGVYKWPSRPQFFDFSPALLRTGTNTLHVRLWVTKEAGGLWPLHVGSREQLLPSYEGERFLHDTVSWIAAAIAGILGAMMLLIWLGRRRDTMFGLFAAAALSNALYIASVLGGPWWTTGLVFALLSAPMLASLSVYCLRYAGWRWPRFEWAVCAISIVYGLQMGYFLIFDLTHYPEATEHFASPFLFGVPLVLMLLIFHRQRNTESFFLAVAHLFSFLLAAYGVYINPPNGIDPTMINTLPVYLVMAWILTRRFVRSLNEAETLNAELATRVEAKRRELEANYQRLGALEKEQAVVAERDRLMRDMHDGIGGQLISTLSLVEAGEASRDKIAAALRECIEDLRLAIDSLEPTDDDLVPVLGNLRYRVEPRLKARGIALDWQVSDLPRLASMTPQNVLHVLRILQEAFTNVIKHAGASRVCVATRCEGERVLIDIRDDGKGLREDGTPTGGHGLANMRQRAQALGGELRLQASARGTTVTLGLPLHTAAAA
jgi:signal transduction histidine kinase